MVSYRSAFVVGVYSSESALALSAKVPSKQESGGKTLLVAKRSSCPTDLLPKCAGRISFKQLIQGMRLNLVLLRKMSVIGPEDIKDADCKCGRVTQQPLSPTRSTRIPSGSQSTEPDSVKVKLPQGNQYTCNLMHDASNAETYLKWFQTYLRILGKKELCALLDVATVERKKLLEEFKKFSKAPKKELGENKAVREVELAATKLKLAEATAIHVIAIQACYDLFCKLLADDPRDQWDRIIKEVHELDPWTLLDGHKNNGLQMKTSESLEDCITFHKHTVFLLDAAERQKSYMMGSLKKPHKMPIKGHVSRCKTMNGYISLLPTL
jgi:hypothetical protein